MRNLPFRRGRLLKASQFAINISPRQVLIATKTRRRKKRKRRRERRKMRKRRSSIKRRRERIGVADTYTE